MTNSKSSKSKDPKNLKNQILIGLIFCLISAVLGWKLCVSKKDVKEVVKESYSQFRQDILKTDEYKKYLNVYKALYKKSLENLLPGGYMTFGVRGDSILNPGNFTNNDIKFNISGNISFNGKDCIVKLNITNILVESNGSSAENNFVKFTYRDYKIGELFKIKSIMISGWYQYLILLNDDKTNPVFVLGFSKKNDFIFS